MILKMSGNRPSGLPIPLQAPRTVVDYKYLRYVSWSPVGNAIVYVDNDNNIHYRHSAEAEEVQLTSTGNENFLYNGIPDWVAEEEVFEDNKALWWSPDGSKIIYGVFNDSQVDVIMLPRYGNWETAGKNGQGYPFLQYPQLDSFRYPKVGYRQGCSPNYTILGLFTSLYYSRLAG